MRSLQRRLLLLGAAAAGLLLLGRSGSSSHSLRYFYMLVSDPGQKVPQFYAVGYVDEQPFVSYDVATRRMQPQVPWMEEAGKNISHYWARESRKAQKNEAVSRVNLERLRDRYNQSTGLYTLQAMVGCVVGPAGRPEAGYWQYAYDGEDFLSFDKETLTWTAADGKAEISKQKLDALQVTVHKLRSYLEGECIWWLQKYLGYGKENLQRTEPPTVRVARKKHLDGRETLVCRAHGFHPKGIEVSWRKDGMDQMQDTLTGGVVPNADGTYHTWLSIEVDPEHRSRYRCQVAHDSLLEPPDLAWEEPASLASVGLIVGVLVGVLILLAAALLGGVFIKYIRRRNRARGGYAAPADGSQGSKDSDNSSSLESIHSTDGDSLCATSSRNTLSGSLPEIRAASTWQTGSDVTFQLELGVLEPSHSRVLRSPLLL